MALFKLLLHFIKELLFGKVNLWQYFKTHKLIALIFCCLIISVAMAVMISRQGFHYSALALKYKAENARLVTALQKCAAEKKTVSYIYKPITVESMKTCKVHTDVVIKPVDRSKSANVVKTHTPQSKVNEILKRELGDLQ